jgi:DNA-directed RNA polymerase subunit RPC12/RpoP
MSFLDTARSVISGEERTFEYRCTDCETSFESTTAKMADVDYPECNSTQIRSAHY